LSGGTTHPQSLTWKLSGGTTLENSAISYLEVVWLDNPGKFRNLLPGSSMARQPWKNPQSLSWKMSGGTTLKQSAISYLEVVWRDNPRKIRNLFPGRCLAGQPWKNPQYFTWKLSGGTTLEKYSKRDLSESSREVLA
jgi:uncharacterized protein YbdZ (MbtH family)